MSTGLAALASWRISASLSGSPWSATCHLKANIASGPKRPVINGLSRAPSAAVAVLEGGAGRQVTAQAARPQHVDADATQRCDPVVEEGDQLVGVEADLVGHAQLEEAVEHRPGLGGRAQRDGGVGAGALVEPVVVGRPGPQQGRVAQVERVELVVDLEHQPHGPGGQLLLVGFDA